MSDAILIDSFSKSFGPVRAVDGLSLRVEQGEIYGFLGLNGAGKTTTIRALFGMIRPTSGSIRLFGQAVGPYGRGPWKAVGHLVGRPAAYADLTVEENLEIARRMSAIADRSATRRAIDRLRLSAYAGRKAGTLSTGNLQRLALARALLHEPELLLLDEPSDGLDPAGIVEIRDLLASLARDHGVTVFMSSHILAEVDRLAGRIAIIHEGRLIEELGSARLESLRARRLVIATRAPGVAQAALAAAGYAAAPHASADAGSLVVLDAGAIEAPDHIATLLVNAGAPPTRLVVEQEALEAHFLRVTGQRS